MEAFQRRHRYSNGLCRSSERWQIGKERGRDIEGKKRTESKKRKIRA